ncbi:MAG: LysM peptidoglycan-binding domain-containing protein [Clostridia bacterium]|nr:LysM peptidoglycan-binding domain-containing protein [Clostridia bacterium]
MVFEPNYTKVVSSIRDRLGVMQTEVDVRLSTDKDKVDSVLSVGADVTHLATSVSNKDVTISGLLNVTAVTLTDGEPNVLTYTADFKDKYVSQNNVLGEVILSGEVVDISYSVIGREVRVKAIIEIILDEIKNKEYSVLTSVNNDNVFTKIENINFETYSGIATDKFDTNYEFDITGAKEILYALPTIKLTSVTPNDKFLTISGKVYLDVCYKTGDTLQDINKTNIEYDFVQEVLNDGLNKDSNIQSILDKVMTEFKLDTNLVDNKMVVSVTLPILYRGFIFNKYEIQSVMDIYSSTNYLGVTYDTISVMHSKDVISFTDKVDGVISISETAPFIDEIVGVCLNNVALTKSGVGDGSLLIEGVVSVTAVYYSKENESLNSVIIDMPFALDEMVEYGDMVKTISTLAVENISSRSRRGKEIEVNLDLNVYTEVYENMSDMIITDVTLGDTLQRDNCVLTIYIVREGDTVWSIAKDLGVSLDVIYAQNDIGDVLRVGEKLIIYSPIQKSVS